MNEDNKQNSFQHSKLEVSDKIRAIGELEHIRAHALRSMIVADSEDNSEAAFWFQVLAKQAKDLRREYMGKYFGDIDSKYWCLCKSAATLRQIAYEVGGDDREQMREIDNIVDDIWSKATGTDLSDCAACKEDKGDIE